MISHANFLKTSNKDKELNIYRIFPIGGGYNYIGDIVALIVWYFVVVFIIVSIPVGILVIVLTVKNNEVTNNVSEFPQNLGFLVVYVLVHLSKGHVRFFFYVNVNIFVNLIFDPAANQLPRVNFSATI